MSWLNTTTGPIIIFVWMMICSIVLMYVERDI